MLSSYKRWFSLLLVLVCLPVLLRAQSSQGRISGQVTDSTGGVIASAGVTIENLGTHVKRDLQTNAAGEYVAPGLEPGFYSITVQATGFSKVVRERVQIEVANDLKINFELKPGTLSEVIEVKDEAPLTESTNAVLSGVLSNQAINELPLQGRDFQNLLPLHPGVQRDPGGGFHTLTSNGLRPDDNNFIIDGANDNDVYYGETVVNDAGISGTPASTLPLDAIQEFNTQEQPQADFGSKPGVVVNIGIKSGTDQIHGTAYYFHRNSAFDARNYFNPSGTPLSALLLHQFGASIGGPIIKNKWFYFANYEGVRDRVGNPLDVDSPVTSSLVGRVDPSTLNYPLEDYSIVDAKAANNCNATPSPCNPLSMNLTKLFLPNPGLTVSASDPALINFNFNNTNREDNLVFKSDYHPNEHHTISGRYIYANTHETEEDGFALRPEWLSNASPITQVFGLDWTWTPNSAWVNDARFSYNRFSENITPADSNVNPTSYELNYGLNTGVTDPRLYGFPHINPGRHIFNYMGGVSSWPLSTSPSRTNNYSDAVTYSRGKHSLRFGGVFSDGGVNYYRAGYGRGRVDFNNLDDFLTSSADDPTANNVHSWRLLYGDPGRNISLKSFGLYAQDDYRISRHVTLNLGMRYDVTFPIKDAKNQLANYVPSVGFVQVGQGISAPYQTNYNNVSPRLGVAWDIFGTGKTILRSGFGMIYVQPSIRTFMFSGGGLNLNPTGIIIDGQQGTGTITSFLQTAADTSLINWNTTGPIFPVTTTSSNSCDASSPCSNFFAVDRHIKTPYVLNWNLNLQEALSSSMVLQVAYVANHGVKLYSTIDLNQVNPALDDGSEQLGRPMTASCPAPTGLGVGSAPCLPYIGFLNYLGNQSTSTYNALQITLTKKYSKGLYLLAGYTFAHAIDTAGGTTNLASVPQDSNNFAAEKGSGDYDIRHRFTLSATYELPSVKSKFQMLEKWQVTSLVTIQGGYPMEFYDAGNDLTLTGEGYNNNGSDRWNISGAPSKIHWSQSTPIPFLDASDPICQGVATTPALQDSLNYVGGCYAQNGTVLYPNAFGTFGNMGRNIFRGPGFVDWDASIGKVWSFSERFRLQLRAEFFNLLNHPSFAPGSINKDFSSSNLGLATGTPDVYASNPVIGSGGSRHIQLGLKLIW